MFTNTSRLLVAMLLLALVAMFVPAPLKAAALAKHGCCAHMQMPVDDSAEHCPAHQQTPEDQQHDTSCCQACALGLALLFVTPAPLVYAQTGEQSLVSSPARSHSLPERPPVPPPRSAIG
jgi:hypothetical protein